jgi:hypothetical protein
MRKPLRDSSENGPEQDSHLRVGNEVHGAVVVLLDEVADQTAILLNGGVLSSLGAGSGSSRRSRPIGRSEVALVHWLAHKWTRV